MAKPRKPGSRRTARTKNLKTSAWQPTAEHLDIYRRHKEGASQGEIAKEYGTNQSNVSRICQRAEAWLIQRTMDDIRGIKLGHTIRLERYVRELEAAWERSKLDAEHKTVEDVQEEIATEGQSERPHRKVKHLTKGQCGQAAYLEAAMSALDRIRKIWGADSPLQVQHYSEPRIAGMDREQAMEVFLSRKLEEVREQRARQMAPQPN